MNKRQWKIETGWVALGEDGKPFTEIDGVEAPVIYLQTLKPDIYRREKNLKVVQCTLRYLGPKSTKLIENSINIRLGWLGVTLDEFRERMKGEVPYLQIRDKAIIDYRYGVGTDKLLTYNEIGLIFGVTGQRIRQREAWAIELIKEHWAAEK